MNRMRENAVNNNMRKLARMILTAALGLLSGGCVVISSRTVEPVVIHPNSPEAALSAEIDAAGKLGFDHSRTAALNSIAARPGLSDSGQVHLVNTVFRRLEFENNQMAVLQTLIKNESFSSAGKQGVLANLPRLRFDNNKASLLQMIGKTG